MVEDAGAPVGGHGAATLRAVRKDCSDRGLRALVVEIGPEEHPARSLYAREGFEDNGRVLLTRPLALAVHEQ